MHKIVIKGKELYCEDGQLLSDILSGYHKGIEHPCAGKGICKKCVVMVNGKTEFSCQYRVKSDITVEIFPQSENFSLTGIDLKGEISENMCFCLDLGTTTLALALVSLDSRSVVKVLTDVNPQRAYGADVISRIEYCSRNGVQNLHNIVVKKINSMIKTLCSNDVPKMYVAANATMLHILCGEDCTGLGVAPYKAVFLGERELSSSRLGITGVEKIELLPSIHAFAGADIVAGINFAGFPSQNKYNLLVDLGTNAEIALYSENVTTCTSAAAGPCFEGANISCGMSAVDGAIYSYKKGCIKTIGNAEPKGICGTGLVDVISELLFNNIIDKTGYMNDDFEIYPNIVITQEDVRQYQLAKSAVCSSIAVLLNENGISFDNIEKVYISGGFSSELNIDNAIKTGLLPEELKNKCEAINNSSLLGTVKYALEQNKIGNISENGKYTDLSSMLLFSELFIENMMF